MLKSDIPLKTLPAFFFSSIIFNNLLVFIFMLSAMQAYDAETNQLLEVTLIE